MLRNCNHQENEIRRNHNKKFKRSAGLALCLLTASGALAGAVARNNARYTQEVVPYFERVQPSFDVGNFTLVSRVKFLYDITECGEVAQAIDDDLVNDETEDAVSRFCPAAMWKSVNWYFDSSLFPVTNKTLCKVHVRHGTDDGQIAKLNALATACKKVADNLSKGSIISFGFFSAALSSLYALYHGKKAFFGADPAVGEREAFVSLADGQTQEEGVPEPVDGMSDSLVEVFDQKEGEAASESNRHQGPSAFTVAQNDASQLSQPLIHAPAAAGRF